MGQYKFVNVSKRHSSFDLYQGHKNGVAVLQNNTTQISSRRIPNSKTFEVFERCQRENDTLNPLHVIRGCQRSRLSEI